MAGMQHQPKSHEHRIEESPGEAVSVNASRKGLNLAYFNLTHYGSELQGERITIWSESKKTGFAARASVLNIYLSVGIGRRDTINL
jgi:hypothetical protein